MVTKVDWVSVVRELGPEFAARAPAHDADDTFVAENFEALRAHKVMSAGVPVDLGGGGAGVDELCAMLRELARHCSSTALALSMHTHQVAVPAWRWLNEKAPVDGLLRRVAAEELVLVSSGGSDWLDSSGELTKSNGGYVFNGRKIFASGSPAGDLLITSGVFDDPAQGPQVFHFPLSLKAEGVKVLDNWRTLGMRGTGSNDVVIEGAVVPDTAIGSRRPRGSWGPFHLVAMIALPLIYSVYVGIAQAARDLAVQHAAKRSQDEATVYLVGEMENELRAAQIALDSAVSMAVTARPGPEVTNEAFIRRTLAGEAAVRTVEKAMQVVGGASFYRSLGIERMFRDVQAARFHPLQEKRQLRHSGRYALGLEKG
jgi:alkylation response protein AidB-like acyl-CoA dehydrogenase